MCVYITSLKIKVQDNVSNGHCVTVLHSDLICNGPIAYATMERPCVHWLLPYLLQAPELQN